MLFLNSRQAREWLFVLYSAKTRDFSEFPQQARALYGEPAKPSPVAPVMPTTLESVFESAQDHHGQRWEKRDQHGGIEREVQPRDLSRRWGCPDHIREH